MSQVTGRVFINVKGSRLRSKEGAKFNRGGFEREAVIGDDSVHGYMEKLAAPSIECTISHTADTKLEDLAAITGATVTFETDTGRVLVLHEAWVANTLELSKGEVQITFNGVRSEEQ